MALSLAGKTAIVTGAGSGINLAFAKNLLAKRCNVLFADLALRPEAQELVSNHSNASQSPAKAIFQQTDVRDWRQLDRMFDVAKEKLGDVDIVCPGAGVYEPPFSSFWHPPGSPPSKDLPESSRYASLDINLTHPIRTTQLAISHFLSTRPHPSPKSIIHISSIAGQLTPLHAPIYNATKHAINGFVRSLAPLDKRMNIRVTAVAPGVIKTPMWTEDREKIRFIGEADEWVSAEYVAETMVGLVEGGRMEVGGGGEGVSTGDSREELRRVDVTGGMIVEVAKGKRRVVEQFNDPGPSGEGNTVGNIGLAFEEVFEKLEGGGWGG